MTRSRIILVGKGASGKDHARTILTEMMGMQYGVSYTTRPPRENEVEGKDYYFRSHKFFEEMKAKDEWFEYVEFNGWLYGTTKDQFYGDCNVFIMTPKGLAHLSEEDRQDSCVIYFDIDATIRAQRMSERKGDADSIHRRLSADEEDFKDFDDYDVIITSPSYEAADLIDVVRVYLAHKPIARV